jgi:microcystin-dependent protein
MATQFVFGNFFETELQTGVTPTTVILSVPPQATLQLPLIASGSNLEARLVIWDGTLPPEIVGCILNNQDGSLVVNRAQETTTAQAWQAGTQVMSSLTADIINTALAAYFDIAEVLESNFLPLAGGTLTGPLLLAADPTQPLQAVTKNYVDNLPGASLPLSGGTMTGVINMNGNRIFGLPTPLTPLEPASKSYVDGVVNFGTGLVLDQAGGILSGGTATAYTLVTNINYTTYVDGLTLSFTPHVSSKFGATLNPNALGPKLLQIAPGTTAPDGWMRAGCPVTVVYSISAGAFIFRNLHSQDFDFVAGDTKFSYQSADHGRWFLADGRLLSRTDPTTAALFNVVSAILGATPGHGWGTGDGSTTFGLLDGRGRVLAGRDDMGGTAAGRLAGFGLGLTGGTQNVQLVLAHLPSATLTTDIPAGQGSHTHGTSNNANTDNAGLTVAGGAVPAPQPGPATVNIDAATLPDLQGSTPLGGSDVAHSNTQPTVVANMFVRY